MAQRTTTHVLKNSDIVNRPLPSSLKAGEAIVNTADGIMLFSGVTTSTSEWTPAGTGSTADFFEVGSNLYDLKLRNRLTEYEGASGAGLVGKFLSGTTDGFVLADISSISGVDTNDFTTGSTLIGSVAYFDRSDSLSAYTLDLSSFISTGDTYVTAFTYDNANVITVNRNNALPALTVDISQLGAITATSVEAGVFTSGGTNLLDIFIKTDTDTTVTAYTYDNANTFTIASSDGATLDATINAVTGMTVNGDFAVVSGTSTLCDILPQNTWNVDGGCDIGAVGSRFLNVYTRYLKLGTSTTELSDDGANFTMSGNNGNFIFMPAVDTVFHSDVDPDGDLTRNLGAVGSRWNEVHAGSIVATGMTIADLGANRVVYTDGSGSLTTEAGFTYTEGSDTILVGNLNTAAAGSAFIGTGGLIVGAGGVGDVTIQGNLTVLGDSISAFTSDLYIEDNNVHLNYNPTGDTSAGSIGAGWTIQDGDGAGVDVTLELRAMNGFTGLTGTEIPDITEYTGPTGVENRAWVTPINDIVLRSTDVATPNGVRVLAEFDCLDGGTY